MQRNEESDPDVLTEYESGSVKKRIVQGRSPIAKEFADDDDEVRDYVWIESQGMRGEWSVEQRLGPATDEYDS